jgi:hypothetical protein
MLYGANYSGYFLDLAANDAAFHSNTLMLERDHGWSGLCIEPNPTYWRGLTRRKCTVVGAATGAADDELVRFNGHGGVGGAVWAGDVRGAVGGPAV